MTTTGPEKICIIGCWHQGVVGAACLADLGCDVLAADPDPARVSGLSQGRAPLFEPGLDDLLAKVLAAGTLRFTANISEAVKGRTLVFLMFDTPVDENDQSDLSVIFDAAGLIAPRLEPKTILYVTAQVPVGTCVQIAEIIRRRNPAADFSMAYSPENLRLGQAIDRFRHPALPVLGADDTWTLDRLERALAPLGVTWQRTSLRTAEMSKHALNAFLATSVGFANELGNLCDETGADGQRLAEVLRLEPRIGPKAMLFPGLGFSGGTLARDMQTLRGLGDKFGVETPLLDGVWTSNQQQNRLVIRKLRKALGPLAGAPVAVLGLTYKPDTSTLRRSASLEIIRDLVADGAAVAAHDPKADRKELAAHREFRFCETAYQAVTGAKAVVIITGWPEYKSLDFRKVAALMEKPVLIDCNNMLDARKLEAEGFTYLDIGRGRGAK